jgi:hypothetical protein
MATPGCRLESEEVRMQWLQRGLGWLGARAAAMAAVAGAGYMARNWVRYGRVDATVAPDPLLDRFMPAYEIREQHETPVMAPAEVTWRAAREMNILRSPLVRAVFRGRELFMRGDHGESPPADIPLVEQTRALGWGVLAEEGGREIALGAVTRPWEPNPTFESVPAEEFAAYTRPRSVKIAWSLSVHDLGDGRSIFRTETRAMTTDREARKRFRRYWSLVAPGILLIRRESLRLVREQAEQWNRAEQQWLARGRRSAAGSDGRVGPDAERLEESEILR